MEAAIEYARELVEESTKNGVERYLFNLKRESYDKGEEKGMLQGKRDEKVEIAKNLLNLNTDVNTISKATGLSIKEINKLKNILPNKFQVLSLFSLKKLAKLKMLLYN